ncbi:amino acid adenylation domain-containing protein [Waterburya agarophytonicola K14]|uniref:Amino acid adenylation domain-containing protein n=1 Tax=Waterburya agarophytonicola KI4 TaxID=2874699 RepID=A0A964BRK6_9CYAN|nr:non-ribosomal peptide synthetase [Waterburya agarophytonicola]MCC0178324.1 amino acid adenylation domain-containing protein [Waterburya agarophytonicola KI4]
MSLFKDIWAKQDELEVSYWEQKLEDIAPLLDFPTDRARPNIDTPEAQVDFQEITKQNSFILDRDLTQTLAKIAQQENVSVPILLLSAFQVLLHRYTKQQDIVVGCLDWGEGEKLIDLLPVRVTIEEQEKFNNLITIVQEQILEASNYLDSFSKNSINHYFQVLFRFNNLSTVFHPKSEIFRQKMSQRELFLDIIEKSQHLIFRLEYNYHLFDADTIQRICDNYQVLLESIVANPQTTIDSLALISAKERQQVLYDLNQTEAESIPQSIHQLFEARVEQNPSAIAIICQGQQLTYGELNQQANQLAHYLRAKGVAPGSLVGLCIERSLFMVVGVLAILKAGGAYVPLDISNPTARIAYILEDADIKILLTQESLLNKLPAKVEQIICGDRDHPSGTLRDYPLSTLHDYPLGTLRDYPLGTLRDRHLIADCSKDNLNLDITISDLAHIVYTSGSTGKPKGVMLTHGNLSHYAQSLQQAFNITPADVYLHRGSIALIVSARQLLMPLAQGATALIVTTKETRNPIEFFELIKRHGVTIVDHVPSFWRNFWGILNQQEDSKRKALLDNQVRLVAAGGEQVTPEIYQCWRETFKSDVQLANIYGQTEGTGVVTVYQIPEQIDQQFKSLPVGSPIPNMRVYLLDEHLQPVPIGVAAEIHISGAGVAQGYLNRPELTAEKFVPNPYLEGARLYKTGDLGRYLNNGTIQFLGRIDRQVNIQGLRIELGEIEAVLSQSELVVEAAVIVRENNLGETLCAYIVPGKQELTVKMLRSYLEQKLPAYMIPNTFLFVDTFPLTTSGKVDRRALAALDIQESSTIIAPRDRLEAEIVQMVQDLLGIKTISVQDNFIELGGNSLLAARLVTEIANKYNQTIPISRVFQAPTPEALASFIRQEEQVSYPKTFVPIKLGNSQPAVYCIHYLGFGLEYYRPLIEHLNADITLYGLSVDFTDDPNSPHPRDIKGLAAYYVRDLQQFQPSGAYYLMGVSFGGVVAYEMAQILLSQGHEVKFLGLLDSRCPDGNSIYQIPSFEERVADHFSNLKTQGMAYVMDKAKRRWTVTRDELRCNLYNISWIRKYLIDDTKREFAQAKYSKLRKEHYEVNKNYVMQPYEGDITLFRATKDTDPKLNWQQFALAKLNVIDLDGDHLEILQEPLVRVLAEKIKMALQQLTKENIEKIN